jgi:DNA-binding transcriptional MerR regulator
MKMAELEARSGVHRETIRVYLRHGLLPEPEKPHRNIAIYTDEHLAAITVVQRLHRENRLTLAQIAALMQGKAPDVRVDADAFRQLERLVAARIGFDAHMVPIASLVEKSPEAEADALALENLKLVTIIRDGKRTLLSPSDSQLVLLWGEMRAAGFTSDLAFVPGMLGFYLEAAEYVAGWEAETFIERTEGKVEVHQAAAMVQVALPLMLNFFGMLRVKAFMRNIEAHRAAAPDAERRPRAPKRIRRRVTSSTRP